MFCRVIIRSANRILYKFVIAPVWLVLIIAIMPAVYMLISNAAVIAESFDDFIDADKYFTLEGQMCCYAKTYIEAPDNMKVWLVTGNNDGFSVEVNDKCVLKKMRYVYGRLIIILRARN